MIQLSRPVHKIPSPFIYAPRSAAGNSFNVITQQFGENLAPFYKQLGMLGHNGLDFIAPMGIEVYAAHDGMITKTYDMTNSSPTIGYGVWITHAEGWQTVYFHLKDVLVKVGQVVKAGDLIGHADNTGQYTTGSHLHFGLFPKDRDRSNGYDGAISPLEYFNQEQISGVINNTNMNKLNLIKQKNTNEVFMQVDGKNIYIGSVDMFERLQKAGVIGDWNDIVEVAEHIAIDGLIK